MKTFFLIFIALLFTYSRSWGVERDSMATDSITKALGEIEVKGTRVINKDGHIVLLMSKENRNFGTNALDAISSLNVFRTDINATKLIAHDNREVAIFINDMPSTAIDLRGYKGDDIKNVEYYSVTPAKYLAFTSGPVVNIVTKKRIDRLYSAYINTSNAVNTGFGTNQVNLTYADSLNQVKFNYLIDYRDIDNIDIDSYYNYATGASSKYTGRNNKYSGSYQFLQASYQRYQSKHLFNANIKYTWDPGKENEPSSVEYSDNGVTANGTRNHYMKSESNTIVGDLYYRYSFDTKRRLSINIINSYSRSYSDNQLWQQMDATEYANLNYSLYNGVDNHTYSFRANAWYGQPLLGGNFNVFASYEYRQLRQHSNYNESDEMSQAAESVFYKTHYNRELVYASLSWNKNGMTFYPLVGVSSVTQITQTQSSTKVYPMGQIYADWWGKGRLQGFTAQLSSTIATMGPTSGQLTNNATYIDRYFLSIGNPELHPYWYNRTNLTLGYFAPNGYNRATLKYGYYYFHNPFVTVLTSEGDYAYMQSQTINNSNIHNITLSGAWRPIKSIEIAPYIEYNHKRYNTPSQNVRWNYWRAGGSVALFLNNWTFLVAANSPTKSYSGDILNRGSEQYSAKVQYKYQDWSFGAQWNYFSHKEYTKGSTNGFSYCEQKDWNPLHYLVQFTATWTISKGRARKHETRQIGNTSEDTGLVNSNTSKM